MLELRSSLYLIDDPDKRGHTFAKPAPARSERDERKFPVVGILLQVIMPLRSLQPLVIGSRCRAQRWGKSSPQMRRHPSIHTCEGYGFITRENLKVGDEIE